MDLSTDECEALAEFEEELLDVVGQCSFEVVLASDVCDADEVEEVGVAGSLLRQVGVCWRQCTGEVGDGLAGALVEFRVDVMGKDVAAPALVERHLGVPKAQVGGIQLLQ